MFLKDLDLESFEYGPMSLGEWDSTYVATYWSKCPQQYSEYYAYDYNHAAFGRLLPDFLDSASFGNSWSGLGLHRSRLKSLNLIPHLIALKHG